MHLLLRQIKCTATQGFPAARKCTWNVCVNFSHFSACHGTRSKEREKEGKKGKSGKNKGGKVFVLRTTVRAVCFIEATRWFARKQDTPLIQYTFQAIWRLIMQNVSCMRFRCWLDWCAFNTSFVLPSFERWASSTSWNEPADVSSKEILITRSFLNRIVGTLFSSSIILIIGKCWTIISKELWREIVRANIFSWQINFSWH